MWGFRIDWFDKAFCYGLWFMAQALELKVLGFGGC